MRKNENRIIKILIFVFIIIIALIVVALIAMKKSENIKAAEENEGEQAIGIEKLNKTKDISLFLTVDECIKSYFTMIKSGEKDVLLSYLNDKYIMENSITSQNILSFIKEFKNYDLYRIMEMYERYDVENKISIYYLKVKIDGNYIFFKIKLDNNNETFDIYPITESVYKDSIIKESTIEETEKKVISKKTYNFYRNAYVTDEDLSRMYYVDYIKQMLYDPELAYSMLNEEYRKEKFGNIDSFKKYIDTNKDNLIMTYKVETADSSDFKSFLEYDNYINSNADYKMKSYAVINNDDYTQCICGNITGSNYIFKAKYPMDYEVYMDSYTIDLPEYISKYNGETDGNKVLMNLEKIRGALNTKDYKYIYNKLDETFKKNNFPSQKKFEEFIKNKLFNYNNFEYNPVKKDGRILVSTINITDATGNKREVQVLNIVMKLLDNQDFVMSFSMN